ncbi:MAG: hypothetical protein KC994_24105 [Candidatus Omnitrophica bacterium]|nr:hypothetical protein [Candidatus Omnitrophota bacterium]
MSARFSRIVLEKLPLLCFVYSSAMANPIIDGPPFAAVFPPSDKGPPLDTYLEHMTPVFIVIIVALIGFVIVRARFKSVSASEKESTGVGSSEVGFEDSEG